MKNKTHKLLYDAHKIIVDATGTDISKSYRAQAFKKVREIYRKIKKIDPSVYQVLNDDDNHKTINK